MKKFFQTRNNIILVVLLGLIMLNAFIWGYIKDGFYGDEIYSYAFVCSTDECSVNRGTEEEPYLNNWHDSDYFMDYFTITPKEAFDVIGVVKVIWGDDHPPMFDEILEILISVFSQNKFTKWVGLSINFVFFLLTLVFLYLLSKKIFGSEKWATLIMTAYGLSVGAVSNVVYIRMYVMLAFATVAFTYANVLMLEHNQSGLPYNKDKRKIFILMILSTFFGMTTQYYFSVFCGFLCIAVFIYMLIKKQWKNIKEYVISMFLGFALTAIVWPETYNDIFREARAKEAITDVASGTSFFDQLKEYINIINADNFAGLGLAVAILMIVLLVVALVFFRKQIEKPDYRIILISAAVVCYVLMIARIAPLQIDRYVFNIFPLIVLITVQILRYLSEPMFIGKTTKATFTILTLIMLAITILGYFRTGVNYLYIGDSKKVAVMEEMSDVPVVLVTEDDRRYFSCVNSYYVKKSDRTYPVKFEEIENAVKAVEEIGTDKFIVFVDRFIEDGDLVVKQFDSTMTGQVTHLFDTEEAGVYLIEK